MDTIRNTVRGIMREIALWINESTAGRVKPADITWLSLFGHIVIAAAIVLESFPSAALLLIVFGLLDALDGALARVQKSESETGVILDATTDRIKETLLFSALAYVFAENGQTALAALSVFALGGSIITSYVKAKAETAITARRKNLSSNEANRLFGGGAFPFEVRMAVLVVGLVTNQLELTVIVIVIGAWLTMIGRFRTIWRQLTTK